MSLSFGNRTVGVRIDTQNAAIGGGFGVYPFTIQPWLTPHGVENGTVLELTAELTVHGNPGHWLAGSACPVRARLHGSPVSCSVTFPLSSAQILGVEEHRAGQDPGFRLRLHGVLPGDPAETVQESDEHFAIPASTWLRLIEQVNAAVAFTIPIPIAVTAGAHAEGAELLKEARHQLNAGDFAGAVVTARKVMERAQAAANWPAISRNDDPQTRNQDQRWRAIYKAALDQASGAAHEDEVTKEFAYSRREAEAMTGIAAALLKAAPGPLS
jgi:cell division septum initiation protein DivIVA